MANSFLSPEEIEALLREAPSGPASGNGALQDHSQPEQAASAAMRAPGAELMGMSNQNLKLILDIPLKMSVLLGRSRRNIGDVLKLSKGSIVELDRLENEPVDILVNDTLIARGEVVVVREYFGVRITDIISAENRIRSLVSP